MTDVPSLDPERLSRAIHRICEAESTEILRCDLTKNHVHLLLELPPKSSARALLIRLRSAISQRMLEMFREHPKDFWELHLWEWDLSGRSDAQLHGETLVQRHGGSDGDLG